MKAKIITASFLVLILSTAAWQTGYNIEIPKVKQIHNMINGSIDEYSYMPDGRIAKIENRYLTFRYKYDSNMIIKTYRYNVGQVINIDTLTLNDRGLVVSSTLPTPMTQKITEYESSTKRTLDVNTLPITYEYNDKDFLIAAKRIYQGEIKYREKYTYYSDDNIHSIEKGSGSAQFFDSPSECLYYKSFAKEVNTIGASNLGMQFNGHSNHNLPKEIIQIGALKDTAFYYFNYHFDPIGRVKIKASYLKSKLVDSLEYSYY